MGVDLAYPAAVLSRAISVVAVIIVALSAGAAAQGRAGSIAGASSPLMERAAPMSTCSPRPGPAGVRRENPKRVGCRYELTGFRRRVFRWRLDGFRRSWRYIPASANATRATLVRLSTT